MENGALSASDVALLNRGDGMGWADSSFMWIFALLVLAGGGFGGFGNNGFANAIGYQNLATQNDVQRGFDTAALQDQSRDILAAVSAGTAQGVAATNQAKYDNINVMKDVQMALSSQINDVRAIEQSLSAQQSECCCNTLRAIDGVNYNAAMNTAAINANTTAQTQKILDAITGNRMEDLQNRINQLELQNATANVLRYPNAWTYNAGMSPFCGCGCGSFAGV